MEIATVILRFRCTRVTQSCADYPDAWMRPQYKLIVASREPNISIKRNTRIRVLLKTTDLPPCLDCSELRHSRMFVNKERRIARSVGLPAYGLPSPNIANGGPEKEPGGQGQDIAYVIFRWRPDTDVTDVMLTSFEVRART